MSPSPVRALFIQPALPAYRVPFFRNLAATGRVDLEVWCDTRDRGSLASVSTSEFRVAHCPERTLGALRSQPALLRAASTRVADVLILPWNTRYVELVPALALARARGLPTLLWGHGYSKHETPVRRGVRNALGRLASGLVLYSESARRRLIDEGFDAERVFVAQNALDREPIDRALSIARDGNPLRSMPVDDKVILFSSRLEPDKRPELLLEALALVRLSLPARLIVLGAGPLLEPLKLQAQKLRLTPFVEFLGAEYDEAHVAPWMKRAHIFAYPSSIGLSLLHAFHYGLPVVTSDDFASHNPEIDALNPGQNGVTFRDGNAHDFAQAMLNLLEDEPLRARLGAAALATVTGPNGYTLANMVRGMHHAIVSVTGNSSSAD
jgi:glycosyltransferase involved in cell wall biosynthesis